MLIWTEGYRPWIMGGDVNAPLGVEVDVSALSPIDLGRGVQVYEIKFPNDSVAIVEASSGAIVGSQLEQVREDMASAELEVVQQQINQARVRAARVNALPQDQFLQLWKAGK